MDVPSGETEFDYHERSYSRGIGSITRRLRHRHDAAARATLSVDAEITAYAEPLNDRPLVGRVQFANPQGAVIGSAEVLINDVTTPDARCWPSCRRHGRLRPEQRRRDDGRQADRLDAPCRCAGPPAGGVEELAVGEDGWTGYAYDINEHGDVGGQINLEDGSAVPALWRADGSLVDLGLPDWMPYDYARAFAINDSGTVVGNACLFTLEEDGYYHEYNDPFVWTEADGFRAAAAPRRRPAT